MTITTRINRNLLRKEIKLSTMCTYFSNKPRSFSSLACTVATWINPESIFRAGWYYPDAIALLLIVPAEPYQPYSIPPNWGGDAVTEAQNSAVAGAQNSVPSPLSPQRKLRPSKLKYEALELSEVEDLLKEKCLYITVNLVPFESKVFTHYNCFLGPL